MKTLIPDAEYHGESMGNDIFAFTEDQLLAYGEAEYQRAMQESFTYSSTQATKCACCGVHKHTPLRVDFMGGYVCLTCIDMRLEVLDDTATLYAKQVAHWIEKHDALLAQQLETVPKVQDTSIWDKYAPVQREIETAQEPKP